MREAATGRTGDTAGKADRQAPTPGLSGEPSAELSAMVEATWPADLAAADRTALASIYRRVADSSCVDPGSGHEGAIARFPERWIERDEAGRLAGIAGLTRNPTVHRITAGAPGCFGWCAWDCLFVPEILERAIEFESTCPETGTTIGISVRPDRVERVRPGSAVLMFARASAADFEAGLRQVFCAHVRLCADPGAARRFAVRDERRVPITIDEGFRLGRLRNRVVFGARGTADAAGDTAGEMA